MNPADYIVLLLVATLISFALHLLRSRKKNGSSCCGGGNGEGDACSHCGMCGTSGTDQAGRKEEPACGRCQQRKK